MLLDGTKQLFVFCDTLLVMLQMNDKSYININVKKLKYSQN